MEESSKKRLLTAAPGSSKKKKKQKNKHSVLANSNTPKKTPVKQSNGTPAGPKPLPKPTEDEGGIGVVDGPMEDSAESARALFEWMIHPITVEDFYENYWEKKPLLIQREERDYYDGWFSKVRVCTFDIAVALVLFVVYSLFTNNSFA